MSKIDVSKAVLDFNWTTNLYDFIPEHIMHMSDFVLWNIISSRASQRKFDFFTKLTANTLMGRGAKSGFIQCLANGNLLEPDDVIDAALIMEGLDQLWKENDA